MKTHRMPISAIALGLAVLASAAEASAETVSASSATENAKTVALQTIRDVEHVVVSVNVVQQGLQLSTFTAKALTPTQLDAAYDRYVLATLRIDPANAHTP